MTVALLFRYYAAVGQEPLLVVVSTEPSRQAS